MSEFDPEYTGRRIRFLAEMQKAEGAHPMTPTQEKPRTFAELFDGITNEQLLEAARKASSRMCNGDRRWQMTVPVQWDDSDICIGEALRRWEKCEQARQGAEERHTRLAAYIVLLEDAWMLASGVTSEDRRAARELNRARQGVDFDLGRPSDAALAPNVPLEADQTSKSPEGRHELGEPQP